MAKQVSKPLVTVPISSDTIGLFDVARQLYWCVGIKDKGPIVTAEDIAEDDKWLNK